MPILHHYNTNHNPTSAMEIVPYIINLTNPKSVVDVGCGLGQWLKVFNELGVKDIKGIDGPHVPKDKLFIDEDFFQEFNLENADNFRPQRKYDIALNLEVAEHLHPKFAEGIVRMLCNLSDIIIFSAAIPNQTGENHHNEQYPEYWVGKFKKHEYVCLDAFRNRFWNNEKINWWYRQNMYLMVNTNVEAKFKNFDKFENTYIHPKLFEYTAHKIDILSEKINGNISIKDAFKLLFKSMSKKINI